MIRALLTCVPVLSVLAIPQEALAKPQGIIIEGEDFEGVESFPIWQTVKGRWYAKEHLAAYARGGAYAVANEHSLGAVMTKTLEQDLPAGTHNVWVRVVIWMDSDDSVEVELNGTKRVYSWTIKTKSRGYRWLPGTITTTKAGRQLRVKALKAGQQNFGESPRPPCKFFVLDSIYVGPGDKEPRLITGRKDDLFLTGDETTDGQPGTAVEEAPPPEGNLIENGSFEIGAGYGWAALSKLDVLGSGYLDRAEHKHGRFSLCSRNPETAIVLNPIASRAYRIRVPGTYTLSAWLKAPEANRAAIAVVDMKRKTHMSARHGQAGAWQRCVASGPLQKGDYYVQATGGHFWLDGVQLEMADKPTEYKPHSEVEVGLVSDVPGRIYFPGEADRPRLLAFTDGSYEKGRATAQCRVYDLWGQVALEKSFELACQPGQGLEMPADILPPKLGTFRAEVEVEGIPNSKTEFVFSVAPRPRTMGIEHESWLGIMPESKEYVMASLQRAGFKWMQNIRDTQVSRWCYAEPAQGEIKWHDELVGRARKYGMEPVILLHVNYNRLPKWVKPTPANKNVPADVSLWKSFVRRMVERYKGQVKYWQFSDDIHHFFSADEHAMLLKATYEAAKAADPDCTVIGWRFFNREVPGWEAALKKTEPYSDIIYGADKEVREKYGKQLHSYLFGSSASMYNFPAMDDPEKLSRLAKARRRTSLGRTRAVCRYAAKVGKIDALFYYMAYLGIRPFTTNLSKQAFDHGGAINLGSVTARLLDHLLYKMECLGSVSPARAVSAYHFRRDSDSCVVLWSTEGQNVEVQFGRNLDGLSLLDAMGNAVELSRTEKGPSLALYDTPVFLVAKDVVAEEIVSLLASAQVRFPIAVQHTFPARDGRMFLGLSVTNNTKEPLDLELGLPKVRYTPLKWGAEEGKSVPALAPGGTAVATFPLKYGLDRHAEFKRLSIEIKAGEISFVRHVMVWLASARQRKSDLKLDGSLADWAGTLPIRMTTTHVSGATRRMRQVRSGAITGAEELTQGRKPIIRGTGDISGLTYTQWDAQNLYFACAIKDDSVEKGDRVELFFDTDVSGDRPDERMSDDDFVFAFSIGSAKSVGELKGAGKAVEIPVAYRRTDDGYHIELSLPWKALGARPAPGLTVGFDAAFTDTDQGTMHAQLVWSGAAHNWGDPTGYGVLVLGE